MGDYEGCNEEMGFRLNCNNTANGKCRLCRSCASPDIHGQLWWPQGVANCLRCPPMWMNYLLVLFAGFMMFIMVYMFLAAALEDSSAEANSAADHQHHSQPMKKIVLNHAQLVSLASGFPLKWPAEIESMFQAMGMFGQAGSYMFNPACNGATIASDVDGETVSMFFQKQLVMQMAPFIAIFFSCLFWTGVWIRDKIDPPEERLKRERRKRHFIKKKKHALRRHKEHEKKEVLRLRDLYKKDMDDWKKAKKAAAEAVKKGLPKVKVPPKPDKTDEKYLFKKQEFLFHIKGSKEEKRAMRRLKKKKTLEEQREKKRRKTKVEPRGQFKIKKKTDGVKDEEGKKVDVASPENVLHDAYEGTEATADNSEKGSQKQKRLEGGEASNSNKKLSVAAANENDTKAEGDHPHSPKNLWAITKKSSYGLNHASNVFADYTEHDNETLLKKAALFTGNRSSLHRQDSLSEKIKSSMRISAQMSKSELGKYDKFIATNVTLLYLCYPVLIKSTFQLVACMPIGKNMYLQMDLNVPCYVGQHLFFTLHLFLPAFICWVVGLPLVGFLIMKRNKHRLYDRSMKFRYGTLYTGYTLQCYYWECVISIRKCCVLDTSVFLTTAGAESQALCGMMICMFALIFHLHWKPFIKVAKGRHTLFWAEFWALFVAFLTFWTGLFFFQDVASSGPLQTFFTVELISVNSLFCLMAFRWFLILKLMDTQDLIMTRELQGAQDEELKGQRKTVSWLQQLVPEWRQVSNLWAKKAWKATIKHQIMTRRSLSAFGGINLVAATEAAKSSSKEIAPGNDERSTPGRMKPRRASFSTSAQKK